MAAFRERSLWLLLVIGATSLGIALFLDLATSSSGIGRPPARVRQLLPTVTRYLEAKNAMKPGRMFCDISYLGNSGIEQRFDLYVWEFCQQYEVQYGRLVTGTGWSSPAVISIVRTRGAYRPVRETQPGDGNLYAPDVRRMFPRSAQDAIWKMPSDTGAGPGTVRAMERDLSLRARRVLLKKS